MIIVLMVQATVIKIVNYDYIVIIVINYDHITFTVQATELTLSSEWSL
jgi:hypothetical protein